MAETTAKCGRRGPVARLLRVYSLACAVASGAGLFGLAPLRASEVSIFHVAGVEALSQGELDGVSLDALGVARLAERLERVATIEEPFAFVAAPRGDGWVVGTGNEGRVLQVEADGVVTVLFDSAEDQVHAILVDADGSVIAGTSPNGKVYRIPTGGGEAEILLAPEERYIWALARDRDGRLLVATGTEGRLYRVEQGRLDGGGVGDAKGEVLFDAEDTHLRSLLVRPSGEILVGTAGEGLIVEIDRSGAARTLHDADQPEIAALVAGASGEVYAAALASEGSVVELSPPATTAAATEAAEATVVASEGAVVAGSRPAGYSGARSEVLRLRASGGTETVWSFDKETVFALGWINEELWAGTGMNGKLYRFRDNQAVLEKDADELQIMTLMTDRGGPALLTTNAAALYRRSGKREGSGTLTSKVLDAGHVSSFGSLSWRGERPAGTELAFSVRAGMSPSPDRTWSEWSAARSGETVALGDLVRGRYLQWRATLRGGERTPALVAVDVSYLQENRRPVIQSLTVLDAGEILVPANFNPSNQAYEVAHPNRDGIFTRLGGPPTDDSQRAKSLWKLGYRTLRWEASDPNGDQLVYALQFRRDQDGDGAWLFVDEGIEEAFLSFDATVLPDGVYRFKLVASDAPANLAGQELQAERVSEPVVIDHSPPELRAVERREGGAVVIVRDLLSPLREAVISVDAGPWQPVLALDGLVDGLEERLQIDVPPESALVLVRLRDAAHNVRTLDLSSAMRDGGAEAP